MFILKYVYKNKYLLTYIKTFLIFLVFIDRSMFQVPILLVYLNKDSKISHYAK